jgi:hypothetical protein
MWGMGAYPLVSAPLPQDPAARKTSEPAADRHLQSTAAVTGYSVEASDGMIGRLGGFLVEDRNWAIGDLLVEAGHWYSGKEILISPRMVERISPEESKVFISLTKAHIQATTGSAQAVAGAGYRSGRSISA